MTSERQRVPILDRQITRDVETLGTVTLNPLGQPTADSYVLTTVSVWCARRDPTARDYVTAGDRGVITIMDSFFTVRAESGPWREGQTFTDDEGKRRRVQGVSQIGRAYLELLARAIG